MSKQKSGQKLGRLQFLLQNPGAMARSMLDFAANQGRKTAPGPVVCKENQFAGKRAVVIGSGVGGLTAAYELLNQRTGLEVIVLEANNRTGGRCLTLRTGDTLIEDEDSQLFGSEPAPPQVVRFERPRGDAAPYSQRRAGPYPV